MHDTHMKSDMKYVTGMNVGIRRPYNALVTCNHCVTGLPYPSPAPNLSICFTGSHQLSCSASILSCEPSGVRINFRHIFPLYRVILWTPIISLSLPFSHSRHGLSPSAKPLLTCLILYFFISFAFSFSLHPPISYP